MTSPEDAVSIARTKVAAGQGIGPSVTAAVVQAIDADRLRITELEAAIANNEQHSIGYQAGYTAGEQDANATHAANPAPPAQAPPRQAPTRAMEALQRIKTVVQTKAVKAYRPNEPQGEPTGPLVVRVDLLRAAINPKTDTEPAPPAPTR